MNDLRTAAQQALEAMEYSGTNVGKFINRINAACAALRAALAQQAEPVEPVAEVFVRRDGVSFAFWLKAPPPERTKLYTAPPQRKLVRLTEAEIEHIGITHQSLRQVARAVERAVWEKNNG